MKPFRVVNNAGKGLQTGDIVFSTSDTLTGNLISCATLSHWTHVGIAVWVVRDAHDTCGTPMSVTKPILCLLESVNAHVDTDLIDENMRSGVKLVTYEDASCHYTSVAVRKVQRTLDPCKVEAFLYAHHGTPFITNVFAWIMAYVSRGRFVEGGICCSQLVATFIQDVIEDSLPADSGWLPIHYSPGKLHDAVLNTYFCAVNIKRATSMTALTAVVILSLMVLLIVLIRK